MGGKNYRKGKNTNDEDKRELIFREDGQVYGQVSKNLGGNRLLISCFDVKDDQIVLVDRVCHIRGIMKRKVWLSVHDIVLVGIRDYESDKGDIIHKYTQEEAKNLKTYGELPSNINLSGTTETDPDVVFDYGSGEEDNSSDEGAVRKENEI